LRFAVAAAAHRPTSPMTGAKKPALQRVHSLPLCGFSSSSTDQALIPWFNRGVFYFFFCASVGPRLTSRVNKAGKDVNPHLPLEQGEGREILNQFQSLATF